MIDKIVRRFKNAWTGFLVLRSFSRVGSQSLAKVILKTDQVSLLCLLLDLRLCVFTWAISQNSPTNIQKLDPEYDSKVALRRFALLRAWIKPKLELVPYWVKGLLEYGRSSLELRDINSAFYCGRALLELGHKSKGEELLRRVYLATGEPEKALEISYSPEDIAACKLAMGEKGEVLELLKV